MAISYSIASVLRQGKKVQETGKLFIPVVRYATSPSLILFKNVSLSETSSSLWHHFQRRLSFSLVNRPVGVSAWLPFCILLLATRAFISSPSISRPLWFASCSAVTCPVTTFMWHFVSFNVWNKAVTPPDSAANANEAFSWVGVGGWGGDICWVKIVTVRRFDSLH